MKKEIIGLILLISTFLSSCNQEYSDENDSKLKSYKKVELSMEEYISIAYEMPREIDNDEIESIINSFISIQSKNKTKNTSKCEIEIKNKYFIRNEEDKSSEEKIPILKTEIRNNGKSGVIYISADERFPDILAYIPEVVDTLPNDNSGPTMMLKYAENVVLSKSRMYNQIKDSLRIPTLEKISKQLQITPNDVHFENVKDFIEIKGINSTKSIIDFDPTSGQVLLSKIGPYIYTEWGQLTPYNNSLGGACPDWFGDPTNYNVSSVIVAITQILGFFEPSLNANGTQINWPYLKEKPEIVEPNYFNAGDPVAKRNMVAALMKFCSNKCSVTYTCSGSSYSMNNITNFLKTYGINMDGSRNFDFNVIKTALDNVKLTLCYGKTSTNEGHSWVIDGYMTVSPTGTISNSNFYVHANMGMSNYYNGYYLINSNTGVTFDPGFAHFNKDIVMYTNIRK